MPSGVRPFWGCGGTLYIAAVGRCAQLFLRLRQLVHFTCSGQVGKQTDEATSCRGPRPTFWPRPRRGSKLHRPVLGRHANCGAPRERKQDAPRAFFRAAVADFVRFPGTPAEWCATPMCALEGQDGLGNVVEDPGQRFGRSTFVALVLELEYEECG